MLSRVDAFAVIGLAPSGRRACDVTMFEEFRPKLDAATTKVTRSRESRISSTKQSGRIVVTEGTGSFYKTRTMVQTLHDFGSFGQITAFADSVADSKKMLMSRSSRYSGLNDALDFQEGSLAAAMDGAAAWLAINAHEASLPEQIAAAQEAGVSRVFVLLSADGPTDALADVPALEALLSSGGMEYTVMRTGSLVDAPSGGGLKLGEVDMPVCEDVAKEDVFRFITEALTLPEADRRLFSLCPSEGTVESLRQLRYAGYERREEVQMLLKGMIQEQTEAATEEETAEKTEAVLRSQAEVEAEREEELKMLLERARVRGEQAKARFEYLEAEKEAHRKEQEKYYKAPLPDDDAGDKPAE